VAKENHHEYSRCQIQETEYKIQDTILKILDSGYWITDSGILDTRYRTQEAGY
jgi:uncharacterized protein YjgD (DUF1641 family)